MENSDAFGSSTAPLTWHDFLERMRHPSAADFVKSIKSFIVSFSNNAPDPDKDSALVQEYFIKMEHAFRAHSLWAGCSEEELESAGEGLEKYVMTKLFTRVFASLPEDVKFDEQLSEKMALIQQFIQPENLDIKPTFQNETSWLLAQKELQKINMYKAPRDKLGCILNCCKVINNLLLNASIASKENPPGADEFLPVLIYVTLKANPPQLHSNLLYIQRYRRQSRLVSEASYFFTNMLSAASFISNIDAKSLSMDEIEFESNMESARALQSGLTTNVGLSNQTSQDRDTRTETMDSKHLLNASNELNNSLPTDGYPSQASAKNYDEDPEVKHQSPLTKIPSVSELEEKGATVLLKEDKGSRTFQTYPYLFANVNDLTVNDVENLLISYKELVLKYVSLSKGIATASSSLPISISQPQVHNQTGLERVFEHTTAVKMNSEKNDGSRKEEGSDEGLLLHMESSRTINSEKNNDSRKEEGPETKMPQDEGSLLHMDASETEMPQDESVTHQAGITDDSSL